MADCTGPVEWHFVHNRTDADHGSITVGTQRVPNGEPRTANVLHYWVRTDTNALPADVRDDVPGGALVLSHHTCLATSSTTTTTSEAPVVDSSSTTTTSEAPAVVDSASTTTTTRVRVLSSIPAAPPAHAVLAQPDFTG